MTQEQSFEMSLLSPLSRAGIGRKNENMAYLEKEGSEGNSAAFDIRYSPEEDFAGQETGGTDDRTTSIPVDTQQYKSAKLIVIKDGKTKKSFVCVPETDSCRLKQAYSLRVKYEKHDLDGLHAETLRKLGYQMENEGVIAAEENEVNVRLLHIQYGLFLCVICAIVVCVCKPR